MFSTRLLPMRSIFVFSQFSCLESMRLVSFHVELCIRSKSISFSRYQMTYTDHQSESNEFRAFASFWLVFFFVSFMFSWLTKLQEISNRCVPVVMFCEEIKTHSTPFIHKHEMSQLETWNIFSEGALVAVSVTSSLSSASRNNCIFVSTQEEEMMHRIAAYERWSSRLVKLCIKWVMLKH